VGDVEAEDAVLRRIAVRDVGAGELVVLVVLAAEAAVRRAVVAFLRSGPRAYLAPFPLGARPAVESAAA
jgi:hypothetical protein